MKSRYINFAIVFVAGFVLAMVAARHYFTATPPEPPAAVRTTGTIAPEAMTDFFAAVGRSDFAAMAEIGEKLFRPGLRIPDSERVFASYAVNSYPPHVVYAFYTENADNMTRRVLLTLDESERIESFMAEEMTVLQ